MAIAAASRTHFHHCGSHANVSSSTPSITRTPGTAPRIIRFITATSSPSPSPSPSTELRAPARPSSSRIRWHAKRASLSVPFTFLRQFDRHSDRHFDGHSVFGMRRERKGSTVAANSSEEAESSAKKQSAEENGDAGGGAEEEEGKKAEREATAAVTVAAIAPGSPEAVARVLETAGGDEEEDDSAAAASVQADSFIGAELRAIYETCRKWQWKGEYAINYAVQGSGPSVVLVHGFGASIGHWRRNIGELSKTATVYAIDLLGQGGSVKPPKFAYTMETWAELLTDFLKEVVGSPAVLVGNSLGSLACLITAAEAPLSTVRGVVLINCPGGMNNKAIKDDWRIIAALPLLWLIDFLLSRPSIAAGLFNRIRSRSNIKNVLSSVYSNKAAVDDELVEVILRPADTPGALDAFISIITGPPGPKPQTLLPKLAAPILILWGSKDPFTPIDGPIGRYFMSLPKTDSKVELHVLPNVGHCPHDDRPDLVHEKLIPWLASIAKSASATKDEVPEFVETSA